jgi:hypothetical protein
MDYENIRLNGTSQQAFDKYNGYYYILDSTLDAMVVRTDDGRTAYLYPTDEPVDEYVSELHYDGYYFWAMGQITGGVRFSKWYLQNFLCKRQDTFTLITNATDNYGTTTDRPKTFTVEHYHRKSSGAATAGDTHIHLDTVTNLSAGDSPIIHIGPNSSGEFEEKTVTSIVADEARFGSGLTYSYDSGTEVCFSRRIWLFNDHYGLVNGGSLMELTLAGSVVNRTSGSEFYNITASTFAAYNYDSGSTVKPYLMYMKSALLNFVDVADPTLPIDRASIQEVYKVDGVSTWGLYSLCIEDNFTESETVSGTKNKRDTIFRLQDGATYSNPSPTDYAWSATNLNYAITTVKPYINSISLSAAPAVVPADSGFTQSLITARVKDQYNTPVSGTITVTFTDDDTTGYVDPAFTTTLDANGETTTEYHTGNTDKIVTITASVAQIII